MHRAPHYTCPRHKQKRPHAGAAIAPCSGGLEVQPRLGQGAEIIQIVLGTTDGLAFGELIACFHAHIQRSALILEAAAHLQCEQVGFLTHLRIGHDVAEAGAEA